MSSIKERPNHAIYLRVLRRMTPEQRLEKAFELTAMASLLFLEGLRRRFPEHSEDQIRQLYLQRLELCRNRSF